MNKSIRDTYVFKALSLESTIESCAQVNANPMSYSIPKESVEQVYNELKFKIGQSVKNKIMEEIKDGKIIIIDSLECAALQTWLIADGKGGIKHSVVNAFGKIKIKPDGSSQFNARDIFALCLLSVAVEGFFAKESKVLNSLALTKIAADIYTRMFIKVIDTMYSIRTAQKVSSMTEVLIRLFFGSYVLEKKFDIQTDQMDNTFTYILNNRNTGLQGIDITPRKLFGTNDGNPLQDLESFIKYLSTTTPLLRELDIGGFLRKVLMMYGEKALLMIENYQYFIAYIISSIVGGNLIKDFQIESSIGPANATSFYNTYFDLLK